MIVRLSERVVPVTPSSRYYDIVKVTVRIYSSRIVSPSSSQVNFTSSIDYAVYK